MSICREWLLWHLQLLRSGNLRMRTLQRRTYGLVEILQRGLWRLL